MLFCWVKNKRLIYKCKKCKEEWKKPINELKEKFPGIYQFCNGDLNKFVLLLRKGICFVIKKLYYHLKKLFIVI